jgi:hypothetical protein
MKIHRITFINVECNNWNGFGFTLLGIDASSENSNFESYLGPDIVGEFLGLHVSEQHLVCCFLFKEFTFKNPFN